MVFVGENAIENVIGETTAIISRLQCVNDSMIMSIVSGTTLLHALLHEKWEMHGCLL